MKCSVTFCFLISFFIVSEINGFFIQEKMSFIARGSIEAITWHPREYLAIASGKNRISVFHQEGETWFSLSLNDHTKKINTLAWAPDFLAENPKQPDKILASGSDDATIKLWNIEIESCVQTLIGHKGAVTTVAWHPSIQNLLASGSTDGTVRLWNITQKEAIYAEYKTDGEINSIAWSDDGKYLAVSEQNTLNNESSNTITILTVENKMLSLQSKHKQHQKKINGFVFLNNTQLLSCGNDGFLLKYDIPKKQIVGSVKLGGEISCVAQAKIKETNCIAIGFNDSIELWQEKKSGAFIDYVKAFTSHKKKVTCLFMNTNYLFSASEDLYVKQWDIK